MTNFFNCHYEGNARSNPEKRNFILKFNSINSGLLRLRLAMTNLSIAMTSKNKARNDRLIKNFND